MDERYVVLPEREYKKIVSILTNIAEALDVPREKNTDFPKTGFVGVRQITSFLKIAPSTWWNIVKADGVAPVEGFTNPRKWRAEDIWKIYEQGVGRGA